MNTKRHDAELKKMPLSYQLIETLYANAYISAEARDSLLDNFYPFNRWGFWAYYLLLSLGVGLVLSSIIYFIAFNWSTITALQKLFGIQLLMATCLLGAVVKSIDSLPGKLLLLSASVLVGGFLAIFGQTYPTGSEEYQLFLAWSFLIFIWTVLSRFNYMWVLWFIISNVALYLWQFSGFTSSNLSSTLAIVTMLFNTSVLLAREYWVRYRASIVLSAQWCRYGLVITMLLTAIIPVISLLFQRSVLDNKLVFLAGVIGMLVILGAVYVYRYHLNDITALTLAILVGSLCLEVAVFRVLSHDIPLHWFGVCGMLAIIVMLTIGLFSMSVKYIQASSDAMRGQDEG